MKDAKIYKPWKAEKIIIVGELDVVAFQALHLVGLLGTKSQNQIILIEKRTRDLREKRKYIPLYLLNVLSQVYK